MSKKRVVPLLILCSLFSGLTQAADAWYNVKVINAGKTTSGTMMRLLIVSNNAGEFTTENIYKVDDALSNEILAMGMAGIASNKQLLIHTDLIDAKSNNTLPRIMGAYLTNRPVVVAAED